MINDSDYKELRKRAAYKEASTLQLCILSKITLIKNPTVYSWGIHFDTITQEITKRLKEFIDKLEIDYNTYLPVEEIEKLRKSLAELETEIATVKENYAINRATDSHGIGHSA